MASFRESIICGFLFIVVLLISAECSPQLTRNAPNSHEKGGNVDTKDMDVIFHFDRNEPVNGRIYTGRMGGIYGQFNYGRRGRAAPYGRGYYNSPGSTIYGRGGYGANGVYGRRGITYIPRI